MPAFTVRLPTLLGALDNECVTMQVVHSRPLPTNKSALLSVDKMGSTIAGCTWLDCVSETTFTHTFDVAAGTA